MKETVYHVVIDENDFPEYADRHREKNGPTLREESEYFEGGLRKIKMSTWHGVLSDTFPSADDRRGQVSEAYGIPVGKLHVYIRIIETRKIS